MSRTYDEQEGNENELSESKYTRKKTRRHINFSDADAPSTNPLEKSKFR